MEKKSITQKTWDEFRACGLGFVINTVLHWFGWVIVFEVDTDTGKVTSAYPGRTIYRGFSEQAQDEEFVKLHNYLKENITEINEETNG